MSAPAPVTLTNVSLVTGLNFVQTIPGSAPASTEQFTQFKTGTFVANGSSSVTVADAAVTAASLIIITLNTVGGTVGAIPAVQTITAGTGFTVKGTASDTSTYNYLLIG